MDVMIIPPPRLGGIYEDNRIWPAQWQAADPANRRLLPLENATPQAAVAATRIAARAAGTTGNVIYAVRHGGTGGSGHEESGSADLAPNRAFRVTQFVAFSIASTTGWTTSAGTPLPSISQMEQALTGARTRQARSGMVCAIRLAGVRPRHRTGPRPQPRSAVLRPDCSDLS